MSGRQTGALHMFLQGWNLPKGLSSIKSGNGTHKGLEVFHVDLAVYMLFSQGCSINKNNGPFQLLALMLLN